MRALVISGWLGGISVMHESDLSSDLLLEAKVGGFLVPEGEGGGHGIHSLDAMHDPSGNSCGEVRD